MTLNPCMLPAIAATGIDNMNQGLLLQIPRPIMVMGPWYGFNDTMTGLPVMPFQHSRTVPASPLPGQAVSFLSFNTRPHWLSQAASGPVSTSSFSRFNYSTPDEGASSHWNSKPRTSTTDRQVSPMLSQVIFYITSSLFTQLFICLLIGFNIKKKGNK